MSWTCVDRRRHVATYSIPDHHDQTTGLLCTTGGRRLLSAAPRRSVRPSRFRRRGRSLPMSKNHVSVLRRRGYSDNRFLRYRARPTSGRRQWEGRDRACHSPVLVVLRLLGGQIRHDQHCHHFIGNHVFAKLEYV